MKSSSAIAYASLGLLVLGQAYATTLVPGSTVSSVPTLAPGFPSSASTAVSSIGANPQLQEGFSWKVGRNPEANGTFENAVWVDPSTGGLDFFYQIQNTFKGSASGNNTVSTTFTLQDFFSGVTTDIYQVDSAAAGSAFFANSGFVVPTADTVTSVSRDFTGDLTVTMSGTGIAPGMNSAILVVKTNATDFDQAGLGSFSWNAAPPANAVGGGQNTNQLHWQLDALEPVQTPEPGAYGILLGGLAGVFGMARRRTRKNNAA